MDRGLAPLSMGFSRQNIGVGCHALLQGIFPGIEPVSLMSPALAGRFLPTSITQEDLPNRQIIIIIIISLLLGTDYASVSVLSDVHG